MTNKRKGIADRAIDGLIPGAIAGIFMAGYLVLTAGLSGLSAGEVLGRFGIQEIVSPASGLINHLATSVVYGAIFGILFQPLAQRISLWVVGVGYSMILYLLGNFVVLPGLNSALLAISGLHMGIAHLIYGLVIVWMMAPKENQN